MAPTREQQREQAQAAIHAAALALFAERGFAETSMKAIASRAGVSKGLVHHYFATKDELIVGVVQERQRAMVALGEQAPEGLAPLERLAWVVERTVDGVAADPASFRVLLRAMSDPGVRERVQALVAPSTAFADVFEQAGASSPAERARFFRAALLGVLTTLATTMGPVDVVSLKAQLLALLPRGPS